MSVHSNPAKEAFQHRIIRDLNQTQVMAFSCVIVITTALLVIGSLAVSGALPGATVAGGCAIGLTGAGVIVSATLILATPFITRTVSTIVVSALLPAFLITIGALGCTGTLSLSQVGWGIIGIQLAPAALGVLGCCCGAAIDGTVLAANRFSNR